MDQFPVAGETFSFPDWRNSPLSSSRCSLPLFWVRSFSMTNWPTQQYNCRWLYLCCTGIYNLHSCMGVQWLKQMHSVCMLPRHTYIHSYAQIWQLRFLCRVVCLTSNSAVTLKESYTKGCRESLHLSICCSVWQSLDIALTLQSPELKYIYQWGGSPWDGLCPLPKAFWELKSGTRSNNQSNTYLCHWIAGGCW